MNREILFRGKTKENGKWLYGLVTLINKEIGYCLIRQTGSNESFECDLSTLEQYTGLTDKKGRKIFEGDIVKIDEYVKETFGVKDGKVLYYGGSFFVDKIRSLNSLYTLVDYEYILRGEVIGNIFDNPELLKGETDEKD